MTTLTHSETLGIPRTWTLVNGTVYCFCRCGEAIPLPRGSVGVDGVVDQLVECTGRDCEWQGSVRLDAWRSMVVG